jgi:hypothetical protein
MIQLGEEMVDPELLAQIPCIGLQAAERCVIQNRCYLDFQTIVEKIEKK